MARTFTNVDYLEVNAAVLTAVPVTMAAWFRNTGVFTNFPMLVALFTSGSTSHRMNLGLSSTGQVSAGSNSGTTASAVTSTTVGDANWHHGLAVFAAAASRAAYLDGGSKGTQTTSKTPSGINKTAIGSWNSGTNEGLTGDIAHVAIWNVALSDDDALMLGTYKVSPLLIRPSNLVLYLPYIGRDSPEIDIIGQRNFTVSGATTAATEPPMLSLPGRRRIFLPSATQVYVRTLDESLDVYDDIVAGTLYGRTLDEVLAVTDDLLRGQIMGRLLSDAVSVTDEVLRGQTMGRTVEDAITVTDGVVRGQLVGRTLSEALEVVDTLDPVRWFYRRLDDGLEVIDLLTRSVSSGGGGSGVLYTVVLDETLVVDDEVLRSVSYVRRLDEPLTLMDDTSAVRLRTRILDDSLSVTDNVLTQVAYVRQLEETLVLYDELLRVVRVVRRLDEPLTVFDEILLSVIGSITYAPRIRISIDSDPVRLGSHDWIIIGGYN